MGSNATTVCLNPLTLARRAVGVLLARLGAMLRAALAWRRHRRTERALASLSDEALKDIGLHRSEIHSLTRFPEARLRRSTVGGERPAKGEPTRRQA